MFYIYRELAGVGGEAAAYTASPVMAPVSLYTCIYSSDFWVVFAELHLPSAPTTTETKPEDEDEDDEDNDEEDDSADSEEENLVPVEDSIGLESGGDRSSDDQHRGQQEQHLSTRKPQRTDQNGGVRHHDSKQRHGSKGSGHRCPCPGWPLVFASAALLWLPWSRTVSVAGAC